MPISEVHHVAMAVADVERSVEWYVNALGYRATLRMNVDSERLCKTLGLPAGTTGTSIYVQGATRIGQIELIQWSAPLDGTPPGAAAQRPGVFLIAVDMPADEIEPAFQRVESLGYPIASTLHESELDNYGVVRSFVARDPDGCLVEFLALPSRDEVRAFRAARAAECPATHKSDQVSTSHD